MKKILIFTDGAAKGNPGPGGYGVVILNSGRVYEIGGGKKNTTNNEMELKAVVEALKSLSEDSIPMEIYSDSKYVVEGATGWIFNWVNNGWKTKAKGDVINKELWQQLLPLLKKYEITWNKIPGHVDMNGNDCADRIASGFAEGKNLDLYNGPQDKYSHDIEDISWDKEKEEERRKARKRQSAKAYSYISMVNGDVKTHKTWTECEARVKGKTGVRFKKALDKEEENQIIKQFKGV